MARHIVFSLVLAFVSSFVSAQVIPGRVNRGDDLTPEEWAAVEELSSGQFVSADRSGSFSARSTPESWAPSPGLVPALSAPRKRGEYVGVARNCEPGTVYVNPEAMQGKKIFAFIEITIENRSVTQAATVVSTQDDVVVENLCPGGRIRLRFSHENLRRNKREAPAFFLSARSTHMAPGDSSVEAKQCFAYPVGWGYGSYGYRNRGMQVLTSQQVYSWEFSIEPPAIAPEEMMDPRGRRSRRSVRFEPNGRPWGPEGRNQYGSPSRPPYVYRGGYGGMMGRGMMRQGGCMMY